VSDKEQEISNRDQLREQAVNGHSLKSDLGIPVTTVDMQLPAESQRGMAIHKRTHLSLSKEDPAGSIPFSFFRESAVGSMPPGNRWGN
jgi:hypothetical protein